MTLLYLQGFEGFPNGGDRTALDSEFDFDDTVAASEAGVTTGRNGGLCAFVDNSNDIETALRLPIAGLSSQDDWIVGFAFRTTYPYYRSFTIAPPLIQFRNLAGTSLISVVPQTSFIRTHAGNSTGTVIGSAYRSITTYVWHYLELKVKFHATTGSFTLRLNGETIDSGTNVNTVGTATNTRPTMLYMGNAGDDVRTEIDDIYICDDQGATHNDFLGDITIRRLTPSGAGNSTQFTASAGSNFECVDEASPDDDTTYVESKTAAQKDTYAFGNISGTPASVKAVAAKSYCKKSDAGSRNFVHVARSNGTELDSSVIYPQAITYRHLSSIFPLNPDGSVAWTGTTVNAAEFGFKVNA